MRRAGLGLLILLLAAACTRAGADGRFTQPRTFAVPLGDRTVASLHLSTGAQDVVVKVADLGDELARVSAPVGDVPSSTVNGDDLTVRFGGRTLELTLTSRVTWTVAWAGGVSAASVDLRGAKLAGLDVSAGLDHVDLWLPRPAGVITAALPSASRATVYVPPSVVARVSTRAGAGTVDVDGVITSGAPAGRVWTPARWADEHDRYDVVMRGGVGQLTVARA